MKKINALVAVSLVSLALIGCGSGSETGSEVTTQQADGTSEMMGDDDEPNANLGTANGQDIDEVDVKMNPNMKNTEEEMTGVEELEDQRPEPR